MAEPDITSTGDMSSVLTCHHYWIAALLLFVVISGSYISLIVYIDNTNLGTTNGLWKMPMVRNWEMGTGHPVESGAVLHHPAYGLLSRLIPDSLVSYGRHGDILTFRKMAVLNALFGALASCAVFLLAARFLKSVAAALVVCLSHALSAFILLNSLNSEDVIPAYAFFVIASVLLIEYVATKRWYFLPASVGFLTLVMLFHWTLLPPALAAFCALLVGLALFDKKRRWAPIQFLALFLGAVWLSSAVLSGLSSTNFPVMELLYPGKAQPNGWLGFRVEKLLYAVIGIGNYFSGGRNQSNYDIAFNSLDGLREMTVSWMYLLLTLGGCIWSLLTRHTDRRLKLLAVFGLTVFCAGELEHLYSQPADPQSQIQPMFVTPIGLMLLLLVARRVPARRVPLGLLTALMAAFALNGAYNIRQMLLTRGQDSGLYEVAHRMDSLFPTSKAVLLLDHWGTWDTWRYIEPFRGDMDAYRSRSLYLATPFTDRAGTSGDEAAQWARERIGEALNNGLSVVTPVDWIQQREQFASSLTSVTSRENASEYWDILHRCLVTGRSWDTPIGRFVEILPAPATPK